VRDANGQALAYIYSRVNEAEARQAKTLTADEGRRSRPPSRGCRSCSKAERSRAEPVPGRGGLGADFGLTSPGEESKPRRTGGLPVWSIAAARKYLGAGKSSAGLETPLHARPRDEGEASQPAASASSRSIVSRKLAGSS
jgi:hypothetical protein